VVAILAILITWLVWLGASVGLGLLILIPWRKRSLSRRSLQGGLWVGLGTLTLLAASANIFVPMSSRVVQWGLVSFLVVGWLTLLVTLFGHGREMYSAVRDLLWKSSRVPTIAYCGLVIVGLVLIARFATAEPMDYDTGLYRLGAINYAREFATIPGLANVHDRFGFNSAIYSLAPALEVGPWHMQGFRLVSGLFISALALEVLLRIVVRRDARPSPGDWYLAIALAFVMAIVLTDSGRWVPSPAQDMAALIPALVSTAFLLDAITDRANVNNFAPLMNLSLLAAALSGAIRPLGWLVLGVSFIVAAVLIWVQLPHHRLRALTYLAPGLGFSTLLLVVMLVRDFILSGWLLFPLTLFPMPVAWRVIDPKATSEAITAWGRDPGSPASEVLADQSWLGPWMGSFLSSRELYLVGLILVSSVAFSIIGRQGRSAWALALCPLSISLLPTFVYLAAWFVTAPDVRFGWMGLINVCAIPAAWLLYFHAYPTLTVRYVGVGVLLVMLLTQVANNRIFPRGADPTPVTLTTGIGSITANLGAPAQIPTRTEVLPDGTITLVPVMGENCWNAFPLCVTGRASLSFRSRGPSIQSGFEPIR